MSEIEQLPSEVLYREPEPGEWPVMSTLAHLEELLPYWAREAADLAKAPGKAVGRRHDDPRRIGAVQQHGHDSLDTIVPRIRGSRYQIGQRVDVLPAADLLSTTQRHWFS